MKTNLFHRLTHLLRRPCAILLGILWIAVMAAPQHCFGKDETIYVDIHTAARELLVVINAQEHSIASAKEWFGNFAKEFGRASEIDVRCDPDIPIGQLIAFLNTIEAQSWKQLSVRCTPRPPSDWREWMAV